MATKQIIRVRDLKLEDMRALLDIEYKCFKDPYPPSLLNHLYSLHPDGFLVAILNRRIVGYTIAAVRWGSTGHVLAVGVEPTYRRRGVGTALIVHALDRLLKKGAKHVRLEVRASNRAAQDFYLKLGFTHREMVPNYYADGEPGVVMVYKP